MEITEEREAGVLVVALAGRLDSLSSSELETRLLERAAREERLVVDLERVEYISSAGLRVLLRLLSKQRESKRDLVLCAMAEDVREVFELAGFLVIFAVERTRPLAIARLSAR
jgi:stage II sporulation protein AA (anti-sigma F factor antagonist)